MSQTLHEKILGFSTKPFAPHVATRKMTFFGACETENGLSPALFKARDMH